METFTRSYGSRTYEHTALVRHKGRLIAFAQDAERRFHYAVLDLEDPNVTSPLDHHHWPENPPELRFPNELAEVGAGVADQLTMPVVKTGSRTAVAPGAPVDPEEQDHFLSTTARLSASAPFQVLSDGRDVYLFRQSIAAGHPDMVTVAEDGTLGDATAGAGAPVVDSTLLVDRFVLADTQLQPKLEVRFRRSRSRVRPQNNKDSLGARDMEERAFHEPTQELRFVGSMLEGRFHALLLPTGNATVQRWQIFSHNGQTGALDCYNVERADDGLFNTRGSQSGAPTGHAESALSFDDDAARIELDAPVDPGPAFTIEAWIDVDDLPPAPSDPGRVLIAGEGPRTDAGAPSIWLVGGGAVRFGFGDGRRWLEVLSGRILAGGWNHLAVSYGDGRCSIAVNGKERLRRSRATAYVDGVEQDEPAELTDIVPATTRLTGVGATESSYRGALDDVRVWDRVRPTDQLATDAHRRLTGSEPGLVGYWRLDEASGDTVHDQTDGGVDGRLAGTVSWITSDAPIGIDSGLQRSSIRVADRSFTSAPSALLYFHQEKRTGGYLQESKPVKRHARVMLAVATAAPGGTDREIAALDIGVSSDGLLAELPDRLPLALLPRPTHDGATIEERIAEASDLGQQLVAVRAEVVNLTEEIAGLNRARDNIDAAVVSGIYRFGLPSVGGLDQFDTRIGELRDARATARDLASTTTELERRLGAAKIVLFEHVHYRGRQLHLRLGQWPYIFLRWLGFNDLVSSVWIPEELQVTLFEHADERGRRRDERDPIGWVGHDWNDIVSSVRVEEDERFAARRSRAHEDRRAAEARIPELIGRLRSDQAKLDALIAAKEAERQVAQGRLAALQARVDTLRDLLDEGVSVTMPLVHVDPTGLGVTGGLLGFAWTDDAPQLFDSAAGRLGLYFRGTDDQFFVTYFTTLTQRARLQLADTRAQAAVECRARSAAPEMDQLRVEIDPGDDERTCTVRIIGSDVAGNGAHVPSETWRRVPRRPEAFTRVLNGLATDRAFVGRASFTSGRTTDRLEFADGIRRAVEAGATLVAGGVRFVVTEPVARGAGEVAVATPSAVSTGEPLPTFYIEYDYRRDVTTDTVPADTSAGSLLVEASWLGSTEPLEVDQRPVTGATTNSKWTAAAPGYTLTFDGARSTATSAPGSTFAVDGDVTIEAWVKPGEATDEAGRSQIVHHHAASATDYSLALRRTPLMTAIQLDGRSQRFLVPDAAALDVVGPITIEAWVRPTAVDGIRNIVAHGYAVSPKREVFLRINGGRYEAGSWDGDDHLVRAPMPDADRTGLDWVHLAGVYDGTTWRLFRNGEEIADHDDDTGAVSVNASWAIGSRGYVRDPERLFEGAIDDVRIWKRARTASEIRADLGRRLSGNETDLVGAWHFTGGQAHDASRHLNHGDPRGTPSVTESPIPGYTIEAAVGTHCVRSREVFAGGSWTHVAATHDQSYGVRLDGRTAWVDCGNDTTLDIGRDLTLEIFVQLDPSAAAGGLITRGKLGDGSDQDVPYCLYLDGNRRPWFAFEDADHQVYQYPALLPVPTGAVVRLAVTRSHKTETTERRNADGQVIGASVDQWDDINFYMNGRWFGAARHRGPSAGSSDDPVEIGRAQFDGLGDRHLAGVITEARIWNMARAAADLGVPLNRGEAGLVTWLRFEENDGNIAYDAKSTNHGRLKGGTTWVPDPDPTASTLRLFHDGLPTETMSVAADSDVGRDQFTLGARLGAGRPAHFQGEMEEVRVWRSVRTEEEIQDNLFRRILGEKQDLVAYYPFDTDAADRLADHSLRGNDLAVHDAAFVLSTAPIGEDTPEVRSALAGIRTPFNGLVHGRPAVAEYGDLQYDADNNLGGVLKRCYAFVRDGRWHLVTGFKVGNLVTEWLGQVQFDPQLIGYIEGAPPVPSENLTSTGTVLGEFADYGAASAVEVVQADRTSYTFASSRETGFDMSIEAKIGALLSARVSAGLGLVKDVLTLDNVIAAHLRFEHSLGWLDDATTGIGVSTTKLSRMELRGAPENADAVAFPDIGRRFVPENAGFALVQSDTADVFALRLQHNNALVSFQIRPNPDIPKDWNIITFPIDPRYTKQGTLDGKVGFRPDPNFPNALTYSPDTSYFKPIEAYALKGRLQQEEERLRTQFDQYAAGGLGRQSVTDPGSGDRGAGSELAKLPKIEKRNLVNTYVWTADGGLFAETEEILDVQAETTGGSYSFKGMAGLYTDLTFAVGGGGLKFELDALFGGHLDLAVTKTAESERSFGLSVELGGVEGDLFLRNPDGSIVMDPSDPRNPRMVKAPGKVDAYRFLTFFLEPESAHFDHFFSRVVDPIWLEQSDDPNAVALRQARQAAKAPPCWRIMHRVTYVSRILPPFEDPTAPPLERTMKELDIDSNYELIRLLDPFVADEITDFGRFATAVRDTLRTYHPELLVHAHSIIQYMSLYYGIEEQPAQLLGGEATIDEGAPLAPLVDAGPATLTAEVDSPVGLTGTLQHQWPPVDDLLVTWSVVSGPGDVELAEAGNLETTAWFGVKGVYLLRLDVTDGVNAASDEIRVSVDAEPVIDAGADQDLLPHEGARLTGRILDDGLGDPADRGRLSIGWSQIGGPGEVVFGTAAQLTTTAEFSHSGRYLLRLTVDNGSFSVSDDVVVAVAARVVRGLQTLYVFRERGGTVVRDVAAVGTPLPMRIAEDSDVSWTDEALTVRRALVTTTGPFTRPLEAMAGSGELTIEAWIDAAEVDHPGLARIVTCSAGPAVRNFVLGQRGRRFHLAVRTEMTTASGGERALAGGEIVPGSPSHVVFTRDAAGTARLYVDGELVADRVIPGGFTNWDSGLALTLADEVGDRAATDRAWAGTYHLVALYSVALDEAEIRQNFSFGADTNLSPYVAASADQMIDLPDDATVSGTLLDDRLLDGQLAVRWTQASGPTTVELGDPTSLETTVSFTRSGRYVLRLTASEDEDDGGLSASDETVIVVNQAPTVSAGAVASTMFPEVAHLRGKVEDDGLGNRTDDDRIVVEWSQVDGPADARIEDPHSLETPVELPAAGAYTFSLTVDNGHVDAPPAMTAVYANTPPVVRAVAPGIVNASEPVPLEGEIVDRGTFDPESVTSTEWSVADGPGEVAFRNRRARRTTATFAKSGAYELTLTVTTRSRDRTLVGTASITVIANRPPVVDAGPDRVLQLPGTIDLDGTVSDDGHPDPPGAVSVTWSKHDGPGEVTFTDERSPYTTVGVSRKGVYELQLSAVDHPELEPVVSRMRLDVVAPPRVTEGLQVLYRFDADDGTTVADVSGRDDPIDLVLDTSAGDAGALRWLDPGLRLEGPACFRAGAEQARLLEALRASGALTLEAWIERAERVPAANSPGRILTFSADPEERNFTLGQTSNGQFQVRLRTTKTDRNGLQKRVEVPAPSGLCHVVYTRDRSGAVALHIDGVEQVIRHTKVPGTFAGWKSATDEPPHHFALGDELTRDRPWLGTYRLIAIYDRALTTREVADNFLANVD